MLRKKKWISGVLLSCLMGVLLCACGEEDNTPVALPKQQGTVNYEETDFAVLPDESIVSPEGMLTTSTLQRDREGRLAMYIPEQGMDEGEPYQQVTEYVLGKDGNWERKDICAKSLTKRVFKSKESWIYSMPYVIRGDDGELYVLLQMEWPDVEGDSEEDVRATRYSVLQLDEEQDEFYEVSIRLDDRSLSEIDTSAGALKMFHVLEDGTLFFAFGNRNAVQFDADSGAPVAVCENVPDNALVGNVGYGDKQFVFYSTSNKFLNILDLDSMTVVNTFGEEIQEDYRKREWYYDTHAEDGSIFGFNTSGLYSIRLAGKKVTVQKISRDSSFDSLADATIYDVLVDDEKNIYILIRKRPEGSYEYQDLWEFGVYKFSGAQ